MEIKKVSHLSEAEVNTLMAAGKLLGEVKTSFENNEYDEIFEDDLNIVAAIKEVSETILNNKK